MSAGMADIIEAPDRFWAKVEKSESCWRWTAKPTPKGYGRFWVDGRDVVAHRYLYELTFGPVPEGLMLDHVCHNPACVNPEHLRLVTNKQNQENRIAGMRTSKSGIRGVSWCSARRGWLVVVIHSGKRHEVGLFRDIEAAERAARAKRNELYTHNDADRADPLTAALNDPEGHALVQAIHDRKAGQ